MVNRRTQRRVNRNRSRSKNRNRTKQVRDRRRRVSKRRNRRVKLGGASPVPRIGDNVSFNGTDVQSVNGITGQGGYSDDVKKGVVTKIDGNTITVKVGCGDIVILNKAHVTKK